MNSYFTTIVRGADVAHGGELVAFDWATKQVCARVPVMPENPSFVDPNPRGNSRGGRGVAVLPDGRVAAASYHSIYIYSPDLKTHQQFSHPLFAGLHDLVLTERGTLWVASTSVDAALEFDYTSRKIVREFWPREMPEIQKALGVVPLKIDKAADNRLLFLEEHHVRNPSHLHLNIATQWRGEVYAFFHAFGAVANLTQGKILFRDAALKGSHNLIILDDGTAIINNTFKHSVQFCELTSGRILREIQLTDFPAVRRLVRPAERLRYIVRGLLNRLGLKYVSNPLPFFVRGMSLKDDHLFIGLSPCALLRIDLASGKLLDSFSYSHSLASCVHGLGG